MNNHQGVAGDSAQGIGQNARDVLDRLDVLEDRQDQIDDNIVQVWGAIRRCSDYRASAHNNNPRRAHSRGRTPAPDSGTESEDVNKHGKDSSGNYVRVCFIRSTSQL